MVVICETPYTNEKYGEHFAIFPYELSDFQKYAIEAIVDGHHVLVTAPTGSGKTLPAEFALQYFVSQGKKVIYCSPIKALSNQKCYEFIKKYPSVSFGICTGDVKSNPDAQVIIMTTEILMNRLFKGNDINNSNLDFNIDIENELGCVVFDECHYINDPGRGNVWERSIMTLPYQVQMVMLSATIDNPTGFACWCENVSKKKMNQLMNQIDNIPEKLVYLASTSKRIVPLSHYTFLTTTESIFKGMKDKALEQQIRGSTNKLLLLQDEKGNFKDVTVNEINKLKKIFETKQVFMKRKHVLNSLALHLRDQDMLPAICFVFSRKNVELCASEITVPLLEDDSKVRYNVERECEQILRKLPNFHEYLNLPEYIQLVGLLEKGIGIHHSGMIPILREIVELMISKKYIKILFATDSFAIGLDCPIRTTIFTSLMKFDGVDQRYLLPHEYTQAAGRAGRRGLDTIGYVVHCNNLFNNPTMNEYKTILCGKPQQLKSKYSISYSLMLNLLKKGQTSDFHLFSENSMMQNEITQSVQAQRELIQKNDIDLDKKWINIGLLKTPYSVCLEWLSHDKESRQSVNKKKKNAEREKGLIEDVYSTLKQDVTYAQQYLNMLDARNTEYNRLASMETYVNDQTVRLRDLLDEKGFVESVAGQTTLTLLGKYASCVAEIHPLIISEFMVNATMFADYSVNQLIGLFSCFTDIRVNEDFRQSVPNSDDSFLTKQIYLLRNLYLQYESLEIKYNTNERTNVDHSLCYDIIDLAIDWCNCTTESECRLFIQSKLSQKSISTGEFNKALLKIVTISKEIGKICEEYGHIDLLHKLSKVEALTMKYVATAQSLYL